MVTATNVKASTTRQTTIRRNSPGEHLKRQIVPVAIALGGLAGNNAHGAGVLQAILDKGIKVDMISCTSGQILWAYRYLKTKDKQTNKIKVLREYLDSDIAEIEPTGLPIFDDALLALIGKPGVFRPAWPEFPINLTENVNAAFSDLIFETMSNRKSFFRAHEELLDIMPAQRLVPLFPDKFFQEIADCFNSSDVGIIFNSYSPREGIEYVHMNETSRALLDVNYDNPSRFRTSTIPKSITREAVRQGLWLYEYGFPNAAKSVDGAYFRQIVLSELSRAETIYVARPINHHWIGDLPKTNKGLADLKTEVNFNGAYEGERDKIKLMNGLMENSAFTPAYKKRKGYHEIELVEIEISTQETFSDYLREELEVFDRAHRQTLALF